MRTQTNGGSGGDVRGRSDGSGVWQKLVVVIGSVGSRGTQGATGQGIWQLKCRSGRTSEAPRRRAKTDASR